MTVVYDSSNSVSCYSKSVSLDLGASHPPQCTTSTVFHLKSMSGEIIYFKRADVKQVCAKKTPKLPVTAIPCGNRGVNILSVAVRG